MKKHEGATSFKASRGTVVTIGTFDGVHVGHKKIIKRLVESAKLNHWDSLVLTFFPHPRMVLQKDSQIKLINTITERAELLENQDLDHLVIHPFTKEFSRMTAEEFVIEILVKQLNAKKVIIGYDHRFGRKRNADITDLKKFGEIHDFEVEEISKQELVDVAISSTKVRKALDKGAITLANAYLGYPIMLTGIVVKGKSLGRKIGYPTANLSIQEDYKLIPAQGVYIVQCDMEGITTYGMMNIGTNPTVGGREQTVETYFFDFEGDLYGKKLTIQILARIREEKHFSGVEALIAAMQELSLIHI